MNLRTGVVTCPKNRFDVSTHFRFTVVVAAHISGTGVLDPKVCLSYATRYYRIESHKKSGHFSDNAIARKSILPGSRFQSFQALPRTVTMPWKCTSTSDDIKTYFYECNLEPSSQLLVSQLRLYAAHSLTQLLQPPATKNTSNRISCIST